MKTEELHTLTGAYALGALEEPEREDVRAHLAACAVCAAEVREFEETAARLGAAVRETPPEAMKARVRKRIASVRRLPPEVPSEQPEQGEQDERWTGGGGDAAAGGRHDRLRRLARLPRLTLAACLVAVAVTGGGVAWHEHQRAEHATEQADRSGNRSDALSTLLAAPDMVSASGKGEQGGSGTVLVSPSRGKTAFFAHELPKLPKSKTYQLWFDDHGTMRSAGLLRHHQHGSNGVLMSDQVRNAAGVGLTVEPAGGSGQPTSDPVMLINFPAGKRGSGAT